MAKHISLNQEDRQKVHNSYLSFVATFGTFARNWSFGHHFGMNSRDNINAEFISVKSWDEGLFTRFVDKGKSTHEVVFSEMLGA